MDKCKLAKWYVNSIKQVTNKNNVHNCNIGDNEMIFHYLKNSNYVFLNKLWELIKLYNEGEKDKYRESLLKLLTQCSRYKFIYNDVVKVIYDNLRKLRHVHCNWKEVIHVIKDKEVDYLLTELENKSYAKCYAYLTGDDWKNYEENKENEKAIKLLIINRLGELINIPPLSMEEYESSKNPKDTDKVYITVYDRNKLKELGVNDINKFVNDYVKDYIIKGGK